MGMASFKCVVDKDRTQYSLIPLVECKQVFDHTISIFSVFTVARGRSESFFTRFFWNMVVLQ